MQNSQSAIGQFAGIHLAAHCQQNVVGYSLVADIQSAPTQWIAIREDASSAGNTICCNIATDSTRRNRFRSKQPDTTPPAIVAEGEKTVVTDNLTR
jgi:hypothetical protein